MKHLKFSIVLGILILFFNVSKPAFASEEIVFSDINPVVVDLQKYSLCKEEIVILNKTISALNELNNKNSEIIKKQEEEVSTLNLEIKTQTGFIGNLNSSIDKLNSLIIENEKICDIRVSEAKPSFFQRIKNAASFIAIGVLIGVGSQVY